MPQSNGSDTKPRKLRSACDACHRSKTRCSGGVPCQRCRDYLTPCKYSVSVRTGKPKGSKCRKTIEREQRAAAALPEAEAQGSDSSSAGGTPAPVAPPPAPGGNDQSSLQTPPTSVELSLPTVSDSKSIPTDWLISPPQDPMLSLGESTATAPTTTSNSLPPWNDLDTSSWDQIFSTEPPSDPTTSTTPATYNSNWITPPETVPVTTENNPLYPPSQPKPCRCLATLIALASRDPSTTITLCQYDAMLVLVRNFCDACCSFCRCPTCPKDPGSISLILTTLRLLTCSLENAAHLVHSQTRSRTTTNLNSVLKPNNDDDQSLLVPPAIPPPAPIISPCSGSNSAPIPFQLGMYQNQGAGEDEEEKTQVLGVLIQSNVRRLLGVCWPIWDMLRGLQNKLSPAGGGPQLESVFGLSVAEVASLTRTLIQSQNRLCALLTE
ncbi:hypothetical protein BDV12DRAFT_176982 [Aspergillus spectabilis]